MQEFLTVFFFFLALTIATYACRLAVWQGLKCSGSVPNAKGRGGVVVEGGCIETEAVLGGSEGQMASAAYLIHLSGFTWSQFLNGWRKKKEGSLGANSLS